MLTARGKSVRRIFAPQCFEYLCDFVNRTDGLVGGRHGPPRSAQTHDWGATILNLLAFDHERSAYSYGGREMRLPEIAGLVAREIIA